MENENVIERVLAVLNQHTDMDSPDLGASDLFWKRIDKHDVDEITEDLEDEFDLGLNKLNPMRVLDCTSAHALAGLVIQLKST